MSAIRKLPKKQILEPATDSTKDTKSENTLSSLEFNDSESESEEYILKPKKNIRVTKSSDSKSSDSKSSATTQEIPNVEDALSEYYKLKEKFENEMNVNKRKIINNATLSNREKRSEYLKLMPKCVNCKRPSKKGTIFSITYHPDDDKISEYRVFKAICGNLADPCNLHIELNIGSDHPLDEELNYITNEIKDTKNIIINDKNKLLFGLITTETAIANFDNNKTYINDLTGVYEYYLDMWNRGIDIPAQKEELNEVLVQSYKSISDIKECIKKMNKENDSQFARDAATIYHTVLQPLLNKIRKLKYRVNEVFNDDDNNCVLIQKKHTIDDLLGFSYTSKVVAYDVGLKAMKGGKKEIDLFKNQKEFIIKIKNPTEINDEPIIGQGVDGINWHTDEYNELWRRLPTALKGEFKINIDWMNVFMHKCVNERINHDDKWNGCRLIAPSNLVIPPRKMLNGQYDFGVSIYNKVFNKLPKSEQERYLTLYKQDQTTYEKNYDMLINAMNLLVEKEVNFGTGFF